MIPVTNLYVLTITGHPQSPGRDTLPTLLRVVSPLYNGHQGMIQTDKSLAEQLHCWAGGGGPGGDAVRVCRFPLPFPEMLFCLRQSSASPTHTAFL